MAKGNIVVKVQTIDVKESPLGFHRYASDVLRAADVFESGDGSSPVPYFLHCRVIELALKAFLLAKGFPKKDLKGKLGHNLEKALNSAVRNGLQSEVTIEPKHVDVIKKANAYYADKGFEYFELGRVVVGSKGLPYLKILADVSSRLVSGLKDVCMREAQYRGLV